MEKIADLFFNGVVDGKGKRVPHDGRQRTILVHDDIIRTVEWAANYAKSIGACSYEIVLNGECIAYASW
jgi:hypothetical protein